MDERRRPERATQSAINYLTDLYEQFGDWFLAAAAYNSGPKRVSERAVRALNPWLVQGTTPPGRWTEVRLPAGTRDRFEEIYALIPLPVRSGTLIRTVRPGETLASIAQSYGVELDALQAANGDSETLALHEGQKIQVSAEISELLADDGSAPRLVEGAAPR